MNWPSVPASEFMLKKGGSVNPSKFPNEIFELLSIPAFDKSCIEILRGNEIGSSKSIVQPNDVLLSKIIPHIRRCWVVPESSGRRQIGSGEWIIFRGDKFFPDYLRHFLTSDIFHQQFMNTVAGVGGSLVRARPAQVERIKIPLPPLPQQKKIAEILDAADCLRQKDKQLIEYYNTLSQSLFLDMFGDPVGTEFSFKDLADKSTKGTFSNGPFGSDLLTSELTNKGVPVIYIRDIRDRVYTRKKNICVTKEKADYLANCQIESKDVLISKVGTPPGIAAIYPEEEPMGIITQDVIRIRVNRDITTPEFIQYWFNSPLGSRALASIIVEGTRMRFGLGDLKKICIVIPDLKLQNRFTKQIKSIEAQKQLAQTSLQKSEELFNSLLQRAFKGELTS